MSDALSRREVEDVLTSIRRLVSHEAARPLQGKLVLTPALRVAAPGDSGAARTGTGHDGNRPANSKVAAVAHGSIAGTPGLHDVNGIEHDRHDSGENALLIAGVNAVASPAGGAARGKAGAAPRDDLEALVRQIVASATDQPDPSRTAEPAPPADTSSPTVAMDDVPPDDALESHLAALEASIRQSEQAILGVSEPGFPSVPNITHATQVNGGATAPGETVPRGDNGAAAVSGADVIDIDESGLRAMVAEILREELQGALGERITRNIRKLVRTEVARALTSGPLAEHRRD